MPKLIALFLVVFFSPLSFAASFDCTRVATKMEKLICSDVQFSKDDESLAVTYAKLLKAAPNSTWVKQQQREWLVNVRNRCQSIDCLKAAYMERSAQLEADHLNKTIQSDTEACQVAAGFINRGTLNTLIASSSATHPTLEEIKPTFGKEADIYGDVIGYWTVDLNNDGTLDHLAVTTDGTARFSAGFALSGKSGAPFTSLTDPNEIGMDIDVLAIGGRYYVFGGDKLWNLSRAGEFQSVCKFRQIEDPVSEIVIGKDIPICSEIKPNQIQYKKTKKLAKPRTPIDKVRYVEYSFDHALGTLPQEERFWSKSPIDGLARVDLDNDGQLDNVVRLDFTHPGGRSCSATIIAVTDDTRTSIPDTKLNKLLLGQFGDRLCGPNLDVFVYEGVTYLYAKERNIAFYRIQADKAEKVCEYQERRTYEVVDTGQESKQ